LRANTAGLPLKPGDLRPLQRVPFLILGFAGLFVGAGAGLARLGWGISAAVAALAELHGLLMICAFFGVVISLERAVAMGRYWAYLGALFGGAGGIAAIVGESAIAAWFFIAGSLVLLAASIDIFRRQTALFTFTLALGAACWSVGNSLWVAGAAGRDVVMWWFAFLILTIAGERLELSRFLAPSRAAKWTFAAIVVVMIASLVGTSSRCMQTFAISLLALAAWLLKQDIARRTVRNNVPALSRCACCWAMCGWPLAGHILVGGLWPEIPSYDAALHALGLGFVFSMVFRSADHRAGGAARMYLPSELLRRSLARFGW
jgi:hypothetical protein